MGFWESMKKFTQPYAEDEYDDEDELSLSQKILDKEQIEDLKRYQEQLAQAEETTEEETEPETEMEKDETFYTRSMDLSDEDFMSDDFKEAKLPLWVKLLILILMIWII